MKSVIVSATAQNRPLPGGRWVIDNVSRPENELRAQSSAFALSGGGDGDGGGGGDGGASSGLRGGPR